MSMNEIRYLTNKAIDKGACVAGVNELERSTGDDKSFERLFFKHVHWCLNEGFPNIDWIESTFGERAIESGVLFRDCDVSNMRRVALLRDINVTATYDGRHVAKLYTKGKAHLTVNVSDNAIVFVDAFDESVVTIHASGGARVFVSQYGQSFIEPAESDDARVKIDVKQTNKY